MKSPEPLAESSGLSCSAQVQRATDERGGPSPIRIAQVLEATTGGTRRHLYYLLKHLDRRRFRVTLVYSNARDPGFSRDLTEFEKWGIERVEIPMRREISPLSDWRAFLRLLSLFRHRPFDVVHAHSSKAGFLARFAAAIARVPVVIYSPHSFAFQYAPHSPQGVFFRFLEKGAGHLHNRLVCVSQGESDVALRYGIGASRKRPPIVIRNVVDEEEMKPAKLAGDMRREWGIPEGSLVVGMVAHFRPQKGYRHFIRAIPGILRRAPETRFLVIGDGPLFSSIRETIREMGIEDRVILTGTQERLADFYQVMDVFVLSSLWEGMPYAIIEAMAAGLPVVATDIVGNNELVVPDVNGYLVAPESSDDIARQVSRILEDRETRQRLAQGSLDLSRNRLSIRQWSEQYERVYLDLVSEKRRARR